MTTFHQAQRRGFVKGGGTTYACRCCKRTTRPTGTGDNDGVQLCEECYELAGYENMIADGYLEDITDNELGNMVGMYNALVDKAGRAATEKAWLELMSEFGIERPDDATIDALARNSSDADPDEFADAIVRTLTK